MCYFRTLVPQYQYTKYSTEVKICQTMVYKECIIYSTVDVNLCDSESVSEHYRDNKS